MVFMDIWKRIVNHYETSPSILERSRSYAISRLFNQSDLFLETEKTGLSAQSDNSNVFYLTSGVTTGCVSGRISFSLYNASLKDILTKHAIDFMLYADDTQLQIMRSVVQ